MAQNVSTSGLPRPSFKQLAVFVICLALVLLGLFYRSLLPGYVLASNDAPLGVMSQAAVDMPAAFRGLWFDLNSLGVNSGSMPPMPTYFFLWLFGPLGYSKFYALFPMLCVGIGAWFLFRQLGFSRLACNLGGLAAALNSDFFGVSCWGVGAQVICFGLNYAALGLLVSNPPRWAWLKYPLAGMAVGIGVMEGADNGAIFSVLVAAAVVFHSLITETSLAQGVGLGLARFLLVPVFAVFISAQALTVLVGTSITNVAGTQQDAASKAARWDWATQWSLPKIETSRLLVPGLFGYRMDTPEGGHYWGSVGQQPGWETNHQGFARFSGGGIYPGLLVLVVAAWSLGQSFRKQGAPFSPSERKWIWFWGVVALGSMLLAWGRHAPFYQLLYALPYFSSIRNPIKFMHCFNWALVVLFAYGLHGMSQCYFNGAAARARKWFQGFDRKWTLGLLAFTGLSVLGAIVFINQAPAFRRFLVDNAFSEPEASIIIPFATQEMVLYVMFLLLTVTGVIMVMRGTFAGDRARWAGLLLGALLVFDLGRANQPWIVHWNYLQKYATNPVAEMLREKPYEHRVAILPFPAPPQASNLAQLYRIEWAQHLFQYLNIQSVDVVQMARVVEDLAAFESAMSPKGNAETMHLLARRWQLTNTRYLLGPAGFLEPLNAQLDPVLHRFRVVQRFDVVPKSAVANPTRLEELTAELSTNGQYAVFEFTGALPRASLYAHWQVSTNLSATLEKLASPSFDPTQTVLVDSPIAAAVPATRTNQPAGTVEFARYTPAAFTLKARAEVPSVLLVNDKYDLDWKAFVDGRPAALMRANYIMRGVMVPAGSHTVEFRFRPSIGALYVTISAYAVGVLFLAALLWQMRVRHPEASVPKPAK